MIVWKRLKKKKAGWADDVGGVQNSRQNGIATEENDRMQDSGLYCYDLPFILVIFGHRVSAFPMVVIGRPNVYAKDIKPIHPRPRPFP